MTALLRKFWAIPVVSITLCLVAGCASSLPGPPSSVATELPPISTVAAPPLTGPGLVTISGAQLLRDGKAWTPRALQLSAFVAAPSVASGVYAAAYQNYSAAELLAVVGWGADTVRFQIGQPEMDPQSTLYSASFVAQLQAAVQQARADKLSVILSMQDQAQTGETSPASLPDASTTRAWGILVTLANNDQGIMFELFNEPVLPVSAGNWTLWQTAHQSLITSIRAAGAKNVILVEGLAAGATLQGAPPLTDPLNSVGYAVHPFFFSDYRTPADYDANFGDFAAAGNVVLATEWSTLADGYTEYCEASTPSDAEILLNYLAAKNIGITGFAFDDPGYGADYGYIGTIVQDLDGTPTTFGGGSVVCGDFGFGPGVMLETEFKTGIVPAP
jgi:endoglucanase